MILLFRIYLCNHFEQSSGRQPSFFGTSACTKTLITARVRSTREGNIYTWKYLFVHHWGWGGGVNQPGSRQGVPHPSWWGGGYPSNLFWQGCITSFPTEGTPILPDRVGGYPHLADGGGNPSGWWGYPRVPPWLGLDGVPPSRTGWGTPPCQNWMGYPPRQDWVAAEYVMLRAVHLLRFPTGGLSCCRMWVSYSQRRFVFENAYFA